ncbi:BgTH12-07528 [Blumeria graminis f. sp. triticale]|uniref:BgTH12-07528 n=1 Tax=Blumeria graminis f. sp. triticale TaxID=1689686 RepID=A0A9W4DIP8_BLUGR|nr:BgTH12-07528 [Blumeria graminis f. sp. triticale]
MKCIVAFLLINPPDSKVKDRLVITGNEMGSPHYGVYLLKSDRLFPIPNPDSHIYMTENHIDGPGTYVRAYCSERWSKNEIIAKITSGLEDITIDDENRIPEMSAIHEKCEEIIDKMIEKSSPEEPVKFSEILRHEDCSESAIVSLAFLDKFSVYGDYSNMFSRYSIDGRNVMADVALKIENIVLNGELFMERSVPPGQQFLAWHQGDLHIFIRTKEEKTWHLITDITCRFASGLYITKYVLHEDGPFLPLLNLIEDFVDQADKITLSNCSDNSVDCEDESPLQNFRRKIAEVKLGKLTPTRAEGNIGILSKPLSIVRWVDEKYM